MTANTGHERSSVRANPVRVGARANRGVGGARRRTEVVQPSGGHASRFDFPRIAVGGGHECFEVGYRDAEVGLRRQPDRVDAPGGDPSAHAPGRAAEQRPQPHGPRRASDYSRLLHARSIAGSASDPFEAFPGFLPLDVPRPTRWPRRRVRAHGWGARPARGRLRRLQRLDVQTLVGAVIREQVVTGHRLGVRSSEHHSHAVLLIGKVMAWQAQVGRARVLIVECVDPRIARSLHRDVDGVRQPVWF